VCVDVPRTPSSHELGLSKLATVGWGFAFGSILVPLFGIAALFFGASLAAKGKIGHGAGIVVVALVLASISIWAWWALWIGMSPGS